MKESGIGRTPSYGGGGGDNDDDDEAASGTLICLIYTFCFSILNTKKKGQSSLVGRLQVVS